MLLHSAVVGNIVVDSYLGSKEKRSAKKPVFDNRILRITPDPQRTPLNSADEVDCISVSFVRNTCFSTLS